MSSHEQWIRQVLELVGGLFLSAVSAFASISAEPPPSPRFAERPYLPKDFRRPEVSDPTPQVRIIETTPRPVKPQRISGWHEDPEVSWYGPGFYGKRTACGQAYTTEILGVAHRNLPCGTWVEFRWKGVTKTVQVIDRGPYVAGRTWDLSGGLCTALNHCFTGPIEWRFP